MDKTIVVETFRAYMAGFLDGEGSVSVHKMNEPGKAFHQIRHRLSASLTNCNKEVLLLVQSKYGGVIHRHRRTDIKHTPCYRWRVEGRTAIKFLRDIYPYLRIKRLHAEIAFEFAKTLRRVRGNTRRPISSYILAKRELFYNRLIGLNSHKGGDAQCQL